MAFGSFTEEQDQLREVIRGYFLQKSPEAEVRRLMATDDGYDPVIWQQMAGELGLQGLAIPEQYGGQGFGWIELGIVIEEMGRALVCAPFFSTVVLAATALLESGDDEAKKDYLPGIADGSLIATMALTEESGRWDEGGVTLPAAHSPDGWTLSGVKHFAVGVSLFAVDAASPGLTRRPSITLDQTRKLAVVEFDETPADLIGIEGDGWRVLRRVLDFAAVALAAEQAGGAQAALDMSIGYLNARVQFGQPIGAFQALKHMAADVLIEVESAKSAAYYALNAAAEDSEELPAAASLAKAYCTEAFVTAAHQNIQFHGGMGFTWEVPAHLYFKRARSSEVFLGDAAEHREALARRIGI